MKKFLKQCSFLFDMDAKKRLPVLFLIFLSSSFLDVIGIGLIMLFLALIVHFDSVFHKLPNSFQIFLNHYSKSEVIFFVGAGLICAFIFKGFWGIFAQRKLVFFNSQLAVRLKMRLMTNYQNAAYDFHIQQNSGDLMNKIALANSFASNVVFSLMNVISALLIIIGIVSCLAITRPLVTLFLAVMVGFIFFFYEFSTKNSLIKMGRVIAESGSEINKSILQALGGLKEIRVLGKESFFLNKIKVVSQAYSRASSAYNSLQLIPRYAVEAAASIFLVTLVLGALAVGTSPINIIPTLGVFAAACIRLLPSITQLIAQYSQLRSSSYATGMLYDEMIALENKHKTGLDEINTGVCQPFSQFSLRHVSFHYANAKSCALNNINFTFFRGQSIGLIGSSGAGKSTLVSVILGLLSPNSGDVLIDGSPAQDMRAWLNNFAYIPQSIYLLDETLKRNIAMGTDDADIDEQKLNNAIVMSQLSDVVENLPSGVNTVIGENGVQLSGGQRQRVALARALYYEREIIVMDEATSSLDNETEQEVINAIKKLHGVKTLIVIAHRFTTIQHCDVIYKLEKGRIIASGSFSEVVNNTEIEVEI